MISLFILVFAGVRLGIVFYNWLSSPYLPSSSSSEGVDKLSILIPARNEEKNLPLLLNDLKRLSIQPLEIIIYDDLSTDDTIAILNQIQLNYPVIKVIQGKELPQDWLGKNHACYQLAQHAKGEYILFLDADVRIGDTLLKNSMAFLKQKELHLLSLFPRQELSGYRVWLAVPLMNWILTTLLPLSFVRLLPFTAFSAANGQCMLFQNQIYQKLQPHLQVRNNPVEDMGIMKLYKRKKLRVAVLLGKNDISCHMYNTLKEAINGFSRNVFQFFGGSPLLAFLFAILTTFSPFYLVWKEGWVIFILYMGIILLIRIFFSLVSRQSPLLNITGCIPQQFIFWVILIRAFTGSKQNKITWKERNIFGVS